MNIDFHHGAAGGQPHWSSDPDERQKRYGVTARLDGGAIVDDITAPDGRLITVRFERCPAGWQAAFELSHPAVDDVAVVHRLVTDSLAEAKATVPTAIAYLMGTPVDEPI
jgi:hypothetical protein